MSLGITNLIRQVKEGDNDILSDYMEHSISSDDIQRFKKHLKTIIELRRNNLIDDEILTELIAYASNFYISRELEKKIQGFFNKIHILKI